jgi:hypothetical protein
VPGWLFLRWWVLDTCTGEYLPAPNDPLSFQGAKAKAEALAARLNREHQRRSRAAQPRRSR